MARRPLGFGLRFRAKGRAVQVRAHDHDSARYVVEVRCGQQTQRREHPSLCEALRDFAATWRHRLH